jgi:hypothetical protein
MPTCPGHRRRRRSLEGKTKHQLWLELCDVITRHPEEVKGMKVEAILRSGIRRFTDEVRLLHLLCMPWPDVQAAGCFA